MSSRTSSIARLDSLVCALGPGPWPVLDLYERGWTRGMLQRAVASGQLVRERRGLYRASDRAGSQLSLAVPSAYPSSGARARTPMPRMATAGLHEARLRALARVLPPSAVFSHSSAATELGLWTPGTSDPLVHVTIPGQADRQDSGLRIHGSALPATSVVRAHGVAITGIHRTAIDLARPGDLPHALVALDSAMRLLLAPGHPDLDRDLRRRAVPSQEIEAARSTFDPVLDGMSGWPGMRTARAAVAAADPASASPYESWSRGWILAVGMPAPELNRVVVGASGRAFVGDFVWADLALIGEADGVSKYGTTAREIRAAMRAEKERQADLEAAGWRFVRWVPGDSGATIVARLGRALYLGSPPSSGALRRGA